ncbi:MAG TPA: phasin family protein [Anaerolineae bacterium]|nr:phasin family protein [Anaerolineae bacterium]
MQKEMEAAVAEAEEIVESGVEEMPANGAEMAEAAEHTGTGMVAAVRRVLMAGVGVVVLTKDEIEDFVSKLIERGEIAEQDGRRLIRDVLHRQREEAAEVADKVEGVAEKMQEETGKQITRAESMMDQRIESILGRLNVPSKSDIDALSEKISLLAEKVDALRHG